MGLLDVVRQKLLGDGVASANWPCFIGYGPDNPDQIIVLQYTGGLAQDTLEGTNIEQHFQIKVRANKLDFSACENKWWDMFNSLQDADFSVSPYFANIYLLQVLESGPIAFTDHLNRTNMTANFRAILPRPT